jgi:hypothetical protein
MTDVETWNNLKPSKGACVLTRLAHGASYQTASINRFVCTECLGCIYEGKAVSQPCVLLDEVDGQVCLVFLPFEVRLTYKVKMMAKRRYVMTHPEMQEYLQFRRA